MHCDAFNDEISADLNSLYERTVKRELSRGEGGGLCSSQIRRSSLGVGIS
jgi:hypothetical protein